MVMRETVCGEAEACRQKALGHIERVKKTFTEHTTPEDKFQAFLKLFNSAVYGANRCQENFEGENYLRWSQDKQTATLLHDTHEEGIVLMQLIMKEMEPLTTSDNRPLCQVNGTKMAFTECAEKRRTAEEAFANTDKVYHEKVICDRSPIELPAFLRKLEAIITVIMAHFVFVPEALLT